VLGLASSGLHSNGFSLVRRIIAESGLNLEDRAPFDTAKSLAEALLTPTRIYVRSVLAVLQREEGKGLKALAHITGGGFPENIPRVLPKPLGVRLDLTAIGVAPVFRWLAASGPIGEQEMLRTFNCGVGMVAIAARARADDLERAFSEEGENVSRIGEVIDVTEGTRVLYRGRLSL
jgi:phosphoribosylformylglycinamidine cyclo-ligase